MALTNLKSVDEGSWEGFRQRMEKKEKAEEEDVGGRFTGKQIHRKTKTGCAGAVGRHCPTK